MSYLDVFCVPITCATGVQRICNIAPQLCLRLWALQLNWAYWALDELLHLCHLSMLHLLHLLPSPTSRFAGLLSMAENENKPVFDNVGHFSKNRTDRINSRCSWAVSLLVSVQAHQILREIVCRQVVAPHLPSVLKLLKCCSKDWVWMIVNDSGCWGAMLLPNTHQHWVGCRDGLHDWPQSLDSVVKAHLSHVICLSREWHQFKHKM